MIRIVGGFFLVIGSAGGMELTSLSPMGAFIFASFGFSFKVGRKSLDNLIKYSFLLRRLL